MTELTAREVAGAPAEGKSLGSPACWNALVDTCPSKSRHLHRKSDVRPTSRTSAGVADSPGNHTARNEDTTREAREQGVQAGPRSADRSWEILGRGVAGS